MEGQRKGPTSFTTRTLCNWSLHSVGRQLHSFFYKHMNFLAEAFAKHILCLFFSTKAFMCYVLNFFWKKKAFMCLFSQVNYMLKPLCALSCAYFFRQKPSCAMCLIVSKKAFMCLIGHVLIKNECIALFNIVKASSYRKSIDSQCSFPTKIICRLWVG